MKLNIDFKPRLFYLFRKGAYDKTTFKDDLIAGIIVGIIALPLAIAFGIASGVTPQQGLITAIVAGFVVSFLGGSKFLIGGPTGAFIVIVYGIIGQYGIDGLIAATLMAGIILILMGIFKLGNIIKFIPYPIVVGFTSGIALVIFSTQIKDFLGLQIENVPSGFLEQWGCYFKNLDKINYQEAGLSITCLVIIFLWNKITKVIPGSFIAIVFGIIATVISTHIDGLSFQTIGGRFPELASGMTLPAPKLPALDITTIRSLVSPAFTIAMLCAIESLLAAMVADGVTSSKHNSNTELIGQGAANIFSSLFGGIPATGAIARTMANIKNGGKTPIAGIIHAVVLLIIFYFLLPYAVYIPMACLASILIVVAYNMSEWKTFKYLLKAERSDVIVLLITFFLTVVVDLTVAIEVGIVLAIILFVKRVSETSTVKISSDNDKYIAATENEEAAMLESTEKLSIPKGVQIYEIDGPFFFGLASKLEETDSLRSGVKVRIIRMRKVPFIDSTGVNNLRNLWMRSEKDGIVVILSGVKDEVYETLNKFGLVEEIKKEHIYSHIIPALAKANELVIATK